jgi:hypothetical protein
MTVICANLRQSLRDLADDLERAGADLAVAIDCAIPGAHIDAIVIREEGEPTTSTWASFNGCSTA